jgi:hypothetical protein
MTTVRRRASPLRSTYRYPPRTHLYGRPTPSTPRTAKLVRGAPFPFDARRVKQYHTYPKPRGFWYAMRGAWVDHNVDSDGADTGSKSAAQRRRYHARLYRVVIPVRMQTTLDAPSRDKVLVLRTLAEMLAFADKYAVPRRSADLARHSADLARQRSLRRTSATGGADSESSSESSSESEQFPPTPVYEYNYDLVRWGAVASDFGGLEIPTFQKTFARLKGSAQWDPRLDWYDGWSVPSGCVWGARVLRTVGRRLALVG